jgi:hypothetical protein
MVCLVRGISDVATLEQVGVTLGGPLVPAVM